MDKIDTLLEEAIVKNDSGDLKGAMCSLYEATGLMRSRINESIGEQGYHLAEVIQMHKAPVVELRV